MAKKWNEVINDPVYQALSPREQAMAQREYFDSVVAPQIPQEEHSAAWEEFSGNISPEYLPDSGGGFLEALGEQPSFGQTGMDIYRAFREQAPMLGAGGGAMLGIPFGPFGPFIGGIAGAIGGSGVRDFARGVEEGGWESLSKPLGSPKEAIDEGLNSLNRAMWEGAYAALGEGVGGLIGKAMRPAGKGARAVYEKVVKLAKDYNLPISPAGIANTKMARWTQSFAESTLPGKAWGDRKRAQLQQGLNTLRQELGGGADVAQAGTDLAETLKSPAVRGSRAEKIPGAIREVSQEAYGKVVEEAGGGRVLVAVPELAGNVRRIHSALKKTLPSNDPRRQLVAILESKIQKPSSTHPDMIRAEDLVEWQGKIRQAFGQTPEADALVGALNADLVAWDAAADSSMKPALDAAKETWNKMREASRGVISKAIRGSSGDPALIIRNAFRSGDLTQMGMMKEALIKAGKEDVWNAATRAFAEDLLDLATKADSTGAKVVFQPAAWLKVWDKYNRQVRIYLPELYENFANFTAISRASLYDTARAGAPEGALGTLGRIALTGGPAATGVLGLMGGKKGELDATDVILPSAGTFLLAASLMNPKGFMKQWLTIGASEAAELLGKRTAASVVQTLGPEPPNLMPAKPPIEAMGGPLVDNGF